MILFCNRTNNDKEGAEGAEQHADGEQQSCAKRQNTHESRNKKRRKDVLL